MLPLGEVSLDSSEVVPADSGEVCGAVSSGPIWSSMASLSLAESAEMDSFLEERATVGETTAGMASVGGRELRLSDDSDNEEAAAAAEDEEEDEDEEGLSCVAELEVGSGITVGVASAAFSFTSSSSICNARFLIRTLDRGDKVCRRLAPGHDRPVVGEGGWATVVVGGLAMESNGSAGSLGSSCE